MVIIQIILCLITPVIMVVLGIVNRRSIPGYNDGNRIAYSSKRAKASEAAWNSANLTFASLLLACGANMGIMALALYIVVALYLGSAWFLCLSLLVVQIVFGLGLIFIVTEMMLRRTYDEEGNLLKAAEDEEEAAEDDEDWGSWKKWDDWD